MTIGNYSKQITCRRTDKEIQVIVIYTLMKNMCYLHVKVYTTLLSVYYFCSVLTVLFLMWLRLTKEKRK